MRLLITVFFLFAGWASADEAPLPPRGEEVFIALLGNSAMRLEEEPLCQADIPLYVQLAWALAGSYQSEHTTQVTSSCVPSRFDTPAGTTIDVWECRVDIVESEANGDYVASANLLFDLTLEEKAFIRGSLRCL